MKNMILATTLCAALSMPVSSHAFMCPSTFNQIEIGASVSEVETACGQPASKAEKDGPDNSPQTWTYYLPSPGKSNMMFSGSPGTLKTQISFDGSGNVMNILVNDVSVGDIDNCSGLVSVGDSKESVESSCGKPGFIDKQDMGGGSTGQATNKVTEYTYNSNPPVVLVFSGGKLISKR